MAKTPKKPHGHPPQDWAERLRVWIWVAILRQMHAASDDWMDRRLLPEKQSAPDKTPPERYRCFVRWRRDGDDPEPRSKKQYGYSIVDKADADPLFRGSALWYRSPLHTLLIPPGLTADKATAEMQLIAARQGYFRATNKQAKVARAFLFDDPALQNFDEARDAEFRAFLRERAHIDDVSMLALMFLESATRRAFGNADKLSSDVVIAAKKMCRSIELHEDHARLMTLLIEKRLIENDWSPLVISEETKREKGEIEEIVAAMVKSLGVDIDHRDKRSELQILLHQEDMAFFYGVTPNWTRNISPALQYLLDHFDEYEVAANYEYMRRDVNSIETLGPKGFRKLRGLKPPKQPKNFRRLVAALNRRKEST